MSDQSSYCFCGLALGKFYRELALALSRDLAQKAPNVPLLLLTDAPEDFSGVDNVIAISHRHHFGYYPYNDKVFVLEEALKRFSIAIQIDVDTRIVDNIEDKINRPWTPGITAGSANLIEHTKQYNLQDVPFIEKIGQKLNISLDKARWVGESMFIIRKDNGKEKEFLKMWKKLARYWDIHKLASKDGTPIGLAAASVGWNISSNYWEDLKGCLDHFDAHKQVKSDLYSLLKKRWSYKLRISRLKLSAFFQPELLP